MPSVEHDGIIEFFRRDPQLALDFVRALGFHVPPHDDIQVASPDVGAIVSSHHADALLLFTLERRFVLAIVVEVQRRPDPEKAFVWPLYAAAASLRHRCPTIVLVYGTTAETVRWARDELVFWSLSGLACHPDDRPVVLGPSDIPPLTRAEAFARPYLAAFSATAHANESGGLQAVRIALDAAEQLPRETSVIVRDTIFAALNDVMRRVLTEDPDMQDYVLKSEIMRQWHAEATSKGLEQGLEQGREQGLEQGREQGRERGRIEALRHVLLTTLRTRGLPVDEATEQRVAETTDAEVLDRWFSRALTASAVDVIFTG